MQRRHILRGMLSATSTVAAWPGSSAAAAHVAAVAGGSDEAAAAGPGGGIALAAWAARAVAERQADLRAWVNKHGLQARPPVEVTHDLLAMMHDCERQPQAVVVVLHGDGSAEIAVARGGFVGSKVKDPGLWQDGWQPYFRIGRVADIGHFYRVLGRASRPTVLSCGAPVQRLFLLSQWAQGAWHDPQGRLHRVATVQGFPIDPDAAAGRPPAAMAFLPQEDSHRAEAVRIFGYEIGAGEDFAAIDRTLVAQQIDAWCDWVQRPGCAMVWDGPPAFTLIDARVRPAWTRTWPRLRLCNQGCTHDYPE